ASASAAETTAGFSITSLDNAGTFSFDRSVDGFISGPVRGNGAFIKNGAGTLAVTGVYGDTGPTTINQGTLSLRGGTDPAIGFTVDKGILEFTSTAATISSLAGASGGTVRIGSALTLNQAGDTTFAGALTGTGSFVKSGAGRLTLSGTSSLTGPTTLSAGTLAVNGTLPSTVTVNGGRLEGTGTIGGLVATGGVVAPGSSIGTMNVSGGVSFAPGSVFEVEANAAGASDKIAATGAATLTGGTVRVLAQNGTYNPQTRYTILTAGGGVQGRFAAVTSNLAFLTASLAYGTNDVSLFLTRNDRSFTDLATTPNEHAVAVAANALGLGSPVYLAVLQSTDATAPALFNALSGEIYAGLPALLADDSRAVRNALVSNSRTAPEGISLWADGFAGRVHADGGAGIAGARDSTSGFIAGLSYAASGFSAGLGGGIGSASDRVADRGSRADVDSKFVGGHIGYRAGGFSARAGAAWFWHDVSSRRTIDGTLGPVAADFQGDTSRLFAEAEYDLMPGATTLAPFVAYDRVRTNLDPFAETGGDGRLTLAGNHYRASFASVGARFEAPVGNLGGATLVPRASIAYRHRLDQSGNQASATFVGGTSPFVVAGIGLPRSAIDVDAGVDVEAGRFRIGARYQGSFASGWNDHGGAVTVSLRF
ncbi:MAG: autotransporter domain-containing protein, partial [Allosphingosinicella sp.]